MAEEIFYWAVILPTPILLSGF